MAIEKGRNSPYFKKLASSFGTFDTTNSQITNSSMVNYSALKKDLNNL